VRKASYKTVPNGVGILRHHNGNYARSFLGGPRIARPSGDNNVYLETNQFDSIACNLIDPSRSVSILNYNVFPFGITKPTKSLPE
jgi:hypothetical protein